MSQKAAQGIISDNGLDAQVDKPIVGIQAIEYIQKVKREYVYGTGNRPLDIQSGNISYIAQNSTQIITHQIIGVKFTNVPKNINQLCLQTFNIKSNIPCLTSHNNT